jgi:hypothetical protein
MRATWRLEVHACNLEKIEIEQQRGEKSNKNGKRKESAFHICFPVTPFDLTSDLTYLSFINCF